MVVAALVLVQTAGVQTAGAQTAAAQSAGAGPARHHMVAAANPHAARAGRDILRAGGSAVDAAIAALMVLNLVEPQSSGIGGGGFLMHAAKDGTITAYDGRETAPETATPTMFLDADGKPRKFFDALVGGLSVGVPGLLRMLDLAHRDYGKLPWRALFAPAIALAKKGFKVSARLNAMISLDPFLKSFPDTAAYFFHPDGTPRRVGETLANPAFAATLEAIATRGAEVFYNGPIADDIVATVRSARRNPGGLMLADLTSYRAKRRSPICAPYREWRVCGMGPPSSGGITTLQILGILSHFDMAALAPESIQAVHLISEASRLAYADRNRFIADSDRIDVPIRALLDPAYLARRAGLIAPARSMGRASPGRIAGLLPGPAGPPPPESPSTTHLSVIDGDGTAVALTASIEAIFGSQLMVRGFLLNNELTDFTFRAERDGRPLANRPGPGKRPLSSMAPTLVFDRDGKVVMTLGSPGGKRIIAYVARTMVAVLDWNLSLQAAMALPHHVNRNGKTELERGRAVTALGPELERMGHDVAIHRLTSGLHGVMTTPAGLVGGADPRREGVVLGD